MPRSIKSTSGLEDCMADLSEIRRRLKAWPSIKDLRRYYVNDVEDLIHDEVWMKCNELGYFNLKLRVV